MTARWPALTTVTLVASVALAGVGGFFLFIGPADIAVAGAGVLLNLVAIVGAIALLLTPGDDSATRVRGAGRRFALVFASVLLAYLFTFAYLYRCTAATYVHGTPPFQGDVQNAWVALYFATTVFTTTGFGDVLPQTVSAQQAVTLQMLSGFAIAATGLAAVAETLRTKQPQ